MVALDVAIQNINTMYLNSLVRRSGSNEDSMNPPPVHWSKALPPFICRRRPE